MMSNTTEYYRKLEHMYLSAPINDIFPPEITIMKGMAEITLEIKPSYHHAAGSLHGGVYFKLLDDAAFFAAQSLVSDVFILTSSFTIYLLKPIINGKIKSEGIVIQDSKHLIVAQSTLFDANNQIVATGSGTFMKSGTLLSKVLT